MMEIEMYDVLIIGSGPAGMGAAVYAVRAGLRAAVLDNMRMHLAYNLSRQMCRG